MCAKSAKFNRFLYWLTHQYKNLLNFSDLAQIWWVCYLSGFCLFQLVSLKIFHMILCLQFLHTHTHTRASASAQTPTHPLKLPTPLSALKGLRDRFFVAYILIFNRIREFNEFFIFGKK